MVRKGSYILLIGLVALITSASMGFASVLPYGSTSMNTRLIEYTLDNLTALNIFSNDTVSGQKKPSVGLPSLVYEIKIAEIDRLSPIEFDFNPYVERYIDIFTIERREQVAHILGLSQLYFPLFEEMLDKYSLPLELKYLAVVESALNPLAVSPSGAVGLWQFLLHSGRMFNLEVNSYIDERMDPIKSTEAACKYLDYLYRIFGDWHLVMAAYNAGPGVVRNAITRSNGATNFWEIYPNLPEAAQNYVPAFIAAAYVLENASDHGITPILPTLTYNQVDTVHVTEAISFEAISIVTGTSVDIIRFLNPTFRKGFIPKPESSTPLILPESSIHKFVENELSLYGHSQPKAHYHERLSQAGSTTNKQKTTHIVQPGEYLHKIAIDYHCTIDDILIWNPKADGSLSKGDSLVLWVDRVVLQRMQNK